MSLWLPASLALLPPLALAIIAAGRGTAMTRLVGLQLATSLTTLLLILFSFLFDQSSSIDLALTFALLTLPGTLVLAVFEERWL